MFDLAIYSKLRGCDIVKVKIGELVSGGHVRARVIRRSAEDWVARAVRTARTSLLTWLKCRGGGLDEYAFPSRIDHEAHISTRQYARLVDEWVTGIGLWREDYGTHSLKRPALAVDTATG